MGIPGKVVLPSEAVFPGKAVLPGEAAEGFRQRVEAVSLYDEDLELYQSLDVLGQVLQTVTGQVKEHLQGQRR